MIIIKRCTHKVGRSHQHTQGRQVKKLSRLTAGNFKFTFDDMTTTIMEGSSSVVSGDKEIERE